MTPLAKPLGEKAPAGLPAILVRQGHISTGTASGAQIPEDVFIGRPFAAPFRIMPFHSTGVADARR